MKSSSGKWVKLQLSNIARSIFPHLVLFVAYFGFLVLGSFTIRYIEGHAAMSDMKIFKEGKEQTRQQVINLFDDMMNMTKGELDRKNDTEQEMRENLSKHLDEFGSASSMPNWKLGRMMSANSSREWSFTSSMLFCMTTITTIGYGDIVPLTTSGRTFCIIYAVFGIPFTLVCLADIGNLLAALVLLLCRKLGIHRCSRHARKCTTENCCFRCNNSSGDMNHDQISMGKGKELHYNNYDMDVALSVEKPHSSIEPNQHEANKDTKTVCENITVESSHRVKHCEHDGSTCEDEVPVLVIFLILVSYVCVGSSIMGMTEGWHFGESVYFTLITLTTIGFGDYIPANHYTQKSFLFCITYILVGLSIMSMTIALMQAKVVRMGSIILNKMGFE